MIRFLLTAAVFALAFPPVVHFVYRQGWVAGIPSFLYETTWLVAVTTGILFTYLHRAEKGTYFVRFYLLSLVVKLIAYLAYNLIVILQDRNGAAMNVVYFLIVYSIFTAIEIGFLYRKISPPSGR